METKEPEFEKYLYSPWNITIGPGSVVDVDTGEEFKHDGYGIVKDVPSMIEKNLILIPNTFHTKYEWPIFLQIKNVGAATVEIKANEEPIASLYVVNETKFDPDSDEILLKRIEKYDFHAPIERLTVRTAGFEYPGFYKYVYSPWNISINPGETMEICTNEIFGSMKCGKIKDVHSMTRKNLKLINENFHVTYGWPIFVEIKNIGSTPVEIHANKEPIGAVYMVLERNLNEEAYKTLYVRVLKYHLHHLNIPDWPIKENLSNFCYNRYKPISTDQN